MRGIIASLLFFSTIGVSSGAIANVVITGTRVIFPGAERDISVKMKNEGDLPALVQVWVDDGTPTSAPSDSNAPFVALPPLFRIEPSRGQSVRVMYSGESLPQDRESLFYFNVLDVPPAAATGGDAPNSLQFAIRSRLKLFYRPKKLSSPSQGAEEAHAKVTWNMVCKSSCSLKATNPTPFYVTFDKVDVKGPNGERGSIEAGGMVSPLGSIEFKLKSAPVSSGVPARVDYTYINDYGALVDTHWLATSTTQ